MKQNPGHLTPDEFAAQGHAVINWIADYQRQIDSFPVRSPATPGQISAALPVTPPAGGDSIEDLLADLDNIVMPGITHWQHPSFFAYFPANASGPAILGDLLASGLGVQGMVWATSPAATEVETRVMDWLVQLLGLPDRFSSAGPGGGVINDTASTAVLTALVAALHRVSGGQVRTSGIDRTYTVYCSAQAHSSVAKAVTIAGIGSANLRKIPTNGPGGAMDIAALQAAVTADLQAGAVPTMIVAAVGTTGTGAIDDTTAIAKVATAHHIWLHVDAAWAGVAAVAPEYRSQLNAGLEYADSYATNPHKWLLTNFDCDAFFVADRANLTASLAEHPEYLRTKESDAGLVIDYRDWHIQLGRRFRALKLWAVLRHYGATGLADHIRSGVDLATRFRQLVDTQPRFLVTHHVLSLVCFYVRADPHGSGSDDSALAADNLATMTLMQAVNDSGAAYLSHTVIGGRTLIRVAVGSPTTETTHIDTLFQTLQAQLTQPN